MTSDHWDRAKELFSRAVDTDPDGRAVLLDESCGGDAELRAEVESLLSHHEQASPDFMKTPHPDVPLASKEAAVGPDPLLGTDVGGFHIKSVIAVGGMGTIYEAVQQQPRRVVALKVMHHNIASRSALRRFQFESQTLGRLRHRCVAQIFGAGIHRVGSITVPYFAMEYIPGAKSITQYAADKKLSTRDCLTLFAKVCDAVHHGHQKGVIHRDLKPANIMVDGAGEPKIIDFGVARATDSDLALTTQQTNIGQLVGTVQYMSPEQCGADPNDLDTRSDVYALGVVLYEILAGALPYEAASSTIYQATRIIREHPPRRLSLVKPKLRGDVEAIVHKALEKDRDRRYQSAAELSGDIGRHLRSEPITARPPALWTRISNWISRHPIAATTSVCLTVAIATLFATLVAIWVAKMRPDHLIIDKTPDGAIREVRVLSVAGRVLWKQRRGPYRRIDFADFADLPRGDRGGGKGVVIGYGETSGTPYSNSICLFDVAKPPDEPIWSKRLGPGDLPGELVSREIDAEDCGGNKGLLMDVFPDSPGDEIVAIFTGGATSGRAVVIYDLSGNRLFQFWHDGTLAVPILLRDSQLLVFAGKNESLNWNRGVRINSDPDPWVVFAIRPERGVISNHFIEPPGITPQAGQLTPAWYLRLEPEDALDAVQKVGVSLASGPAESQHVNVDLWLHAGMHGPNVFWSIDANGEEVAGSRGANNAYKRNQAREDDDPDRLPLPDSSVFKLVPFEPASDVAQARPESP